ELSARTPGSRGVIEVPEMVVVTGNVRLEVPVVIRLAPDESSPARTTVPANAILERVGEHNTWTLVRWMADDGQVWFGWVLILSDAGVSTSTGNPRGDHGDIRGRVHLNGEPPRMLVPVKRGDAEICRDKELALNAVLVNEGKLQDAFV